MDASGVKDHPRHSSAGNPAVSRHAMVFRHGRLNFGLGGDRDHHRHEQKHVVEGMNAGRQKKEEGNGDGKKSSTAAEQAKVSNRKKRRTIIKKEEEEIGAAARATATTSATHTIYLIDVFPTQFAKNCPL